MKKAPWDLLDHLQRLEARECRGRLEAGCQKELTYKSSNTYKSGYYAAVIYLELIHTTIINSALYAYTTRLNSLLLTIWHKVLNLCWFPGYPKIIHHGIKSSNILLDLNFEAKILDWQSLLLMALLTSPQSPFFLPITGKKQLTMMDWQHKMKIAIGAARGLVYLHEDCYPKIIHCGIKSSNILLDLNLEPKIANFGLAKLAFDGFTNVSTTLIGTFRYLALEYASSRKLTNK
ncbi:hypothetical protein SUGI_0777240 [Cryptomeria japonica]|nr:hypothetical protein SUGI_0777240 [Cryptomeria japonica]